MKTQHLMTASPACVTPYDTVQRAAQLMEENDCGCLPVVESQDDGRVVGVVTDRDIALRAVAHGAGPETPVRQVMTSDPYRCTPHTDLATVERVMAERKVRRVVVVDNEGRCVGIVAQADLARAARRERSLSDREVLRVIERISEPPASPTARPATPSSTELRF